VLENTQNNIGKSFPLVALAKASKER